MSVKDDLAGVLADSLNKKFKDYKVAYFLDGAQETPTDIKEFISTGSTMLDLAISNRPNGGIAVGRITELNGLESSGKSLVGAHLLAETQKKGGVAVYIDTETAVSEDFLEVIGLDISKMLYLHLETVEDIFEAIEKADAEVRAEQTAVAPSPEELAMGLAAGPEGMVPQGPQTSPELNPESAAQLIGALRAG